MHKSLIKSSKGNMTMFLWSISKYIWKWVLGHFQFAFDSLKWHQGHQGHQEPQGEEKAIVQDLAFHCKPFYFPGLRLMWHLCNWLFLLQSNDGTITPHKFPGQIEFKEMLWEISGNDEDTMLVQVIWGSSEEHLKPNECLWLHNRS